MPQQGEHTQLSPELEKESIKESIKELDKQIADLEEKRSQLQAKLIKEQIPNIKKEEDANNMSKLKEEEEPVIKVALPELQQKLPELARKERTQYALQLTATLRKDKEDAARQALETTGKKSWNDLGFEELLETQKIARANRQLSHKDEIDMRNRLNVISNLERLVNTQKMETLIGQNKRTITGNMEFSVFVTGYKESIGPIGINYIGYKSPEDDTEYVYCSIGNYFDYNNVWHQQELEKGFIWDPSKYIQNFVVLGKLFSTQAKKERTTALKKKYASLGYKKREAMECAQKDITKLEQNKIVNTCVAALETNLGIDPSSKISISTWKYTLYNKQEDRAKDFVGIIDTDNIKIDEKVRLKKIRPMGNDPSAELVDAIAEKLALAEKTVQIIDKMNHDKLKKPN